MTPNYYFLSQMQCIGGLESFGRRRRSLRHNMANSLNTTAIKLIPEQGKIEEKRKNDCTHTYTHTHTCIYIYIYIYTDIKCEAIQDRG